jgi:hypothetical protein
MIDALFLMNLFLALFVVSPLDAMPAVRQAAKVNVPAKMQVKKPSISWWTRAKNYFTPRRSFSTSTYKQKVSTPITWHNIKSFVTGAPMRKNYPTDEDKHNRIIDIAFSGDYSEANLEEIYNLFQAISHPNYSGATFGILMRRGIGKNNQKFKTLYKDVKLNPVDKEYDNNDRRQVVFGILDSYYKDDPAALAYAFSVYSQLPSWEKIRLLSRIVQTGVTKSNEKFKNIYNLLTPTTKPEVDVIARVIIDQDWSNPAAQKYYHEVLDKWGQGKKREDL